MTVLHLGVIEVPYDNTSYAKPRSPKQRIGAAKRSAGDISATNQRTTGDVAEILEDKYHVMELFFEDHGAVIADLLAGSMAGALENIALGAPTNLIPTAEAESAIEDKFKRFLSDQELDGVMPGVPTRAAQEGVSHRFLHPYAKRSPRPSFIDTGLYQANFKAWVE